MKTWKILRDCRMKGEGVHHAMLGIARMHNLTLARFTGQPLADVLSIRVDQGAATSVCSRQARECLERACWATAWRNPRRLASR
jgi:hypothetical protein